MLNDYNDCAKTIIFIFFKMLKNSSLLWVVYGVLFLCIVWVFFLSKFQKADNTLVFPYPSQEIEFSGEEIPFWGADFYNKERFDKEFLLSSNNLYQFYLYVKRYPLYIPYIEEKLKKAGIPDDFKYLPIAEVHFEMMLFLLQELDESGNLCQKRQNDTDFELMSM